MTKKKAIDIIEEKIEFYENKTSLASSRKLEMMNLASLYCETISDAFKSINHVAGYSRELDDKTWDLMLRGIQEAYEQGLKDITEARNRRLSDKAES